MSFNKKRSGFTTLEMLLVIVMLAVIGYVGYYVYHSRNNTNSLYNSAASTQIATKNGAKPKVTPDPTIYWLTVKSPDASFSFKTPKSWVTLTCEKSGGSASVVYLASTAPNLAKCQSDSTGEANFYMLDDKSAQSPPAKDPTYQSYATEPAKVNGIVGSKTTYKTAADAALGADTTYVVYSFLSHNKSFYGTFVELNGLPAEDLATFDQIVQTWLF